MRELMQKKFSGFSMRKSSRDLPARHFDGAIRPFAAVVNNPEPKYIEKPKGRCKCAQKLCSHIVQKFILSDFELRLLVSFCTVK